MLRDENLVFVDHAGRDTLCTNRAQQVGLADVQPR